MASISLLSSLLPVQARVTIPGSKSYTNRALIMAALADGVSRLEHTSPSDDSRAMIKALSLLGVTIKSIEPSTLIVNGTGGRLIPYRGVIDVGPAGSTMRFLAALCATIPGADIELRGSQRLHDRPIKDLIETLRRAGASIEYLEKADYPPIRINSKNPLNGESLSINGSISSQFVSALLLSGPMFSGDLRITVTGELTSTSYLDMTVQGIRDFGVTCESNNNRIYSIPTEASFTPRVYKVEGDASGASYLWALAAISQGEVTVENINPNSLQGDILFPSLLEQMGCSVLSDANEITVKGPANLKPINADMNPMPDTAQTLAVVAACAQGRSTIRGLKTLRIKETDRIAALQNELRKCGIKSESGPDYLIIDGGFPQAASISTYDDHRMAMAFAILATKIEGMTIESPSVVNKSFPNFWEILKQIGINGETVE